MECKEVWSIALAQYMNCIYQLWDTRVTLALPESLPGQAGYSPEQKVHLPSRLELERVNHITFYGRMWS